MTVTDQTGGAASERTGLRVTYDGRVHPAEEIARGAAYELFSADEAPGFEWCPRPGLAYPWRRFVHATEVGAVHGAAEPSEDADPPLLMPLHRDRGWAYVHQLSQQPGAAGDPTLAAVRASAVIRPGTRMVKVLSARQLAGYVRGWLPHGFCYRSTTWRTCGRRRGWRCCAATRRAATWRTRCAGGPPTRPTTTSRSARPTGG